MAERPRALVLDPADNVAVAIVDLARGEQVALAPEPVTLLDDVRFGHKLALRPIGAGEHVRKYDEVIGVASADIAAGEHVHVHNVDSARLPAPAAAR
jgi:predicted RecA/RadA family phage recombinase